MATESPMRIVESSRVGKWVSSKDSASFASSLNTMAADELGLLLKGHKLNGDQGNTVPNRSGSAPPSMEGSFAAFGNLMNKQNPTWNANLASLNSALENCQSEEQLRADPSYFAYYCSNINLNPRLPPPIISRENRHLVRQVGALTSNLRNSSSDASGDGSLHLHRSSLSTHAEEPEDDGSLQQASDSMVESSMANMSAQAFSLAGRHKSLVDLIQEDFPRTPSPVYNQSRSSGHVAADESIDHDIQALNLENLSLSDSKLPESNSGVESHNKVAAVKGLTGAIDTLVDSVPEKSYFDTLSSQKDEAADENALLQNDLLAVGPSGSDSSKCLYLGEHSRDKEGEKVYETNMNKHQYPYTHKNTSYMVHDSHSQITAQGANLTESSIEKFPHGQLKFSSVETRPFLQAPGLTPPLYATTAAYMSSANPIYSTVNPSGLYAPQYSMGGYAVGSTYLSPFLAGYPSQAGLPVHFDPAAGQSYNGQAAGVSIAESIHQVSDVQHLNKFYGQHGMMLHPSFPDPLQMQYFQHFQHPLEDAYGGHGQYGRFSTTGVTGTQTDSYASRKDTTVPSYIGDQKFQFPPNSNLSMQSARNIGFPSNNYYGSPTGLGYVPQYPGSPLGSPVLPGSPVGGVNPLGRRNELRFSPGPVRNVGGYSGWQGQRVSDSFVDPKKHSFLEELKSSNARKVDLPDIAGRIVEFSVDQHGSRFIQQKLENCADEEKASVFKEILPHASKLMTDVFGNYVIQKFFEHGSYEQRKELANQLSGQMLTLSLQMYGCRVIQKALEVIDLAQKTELVHELDGHVMRCVRDQNGNHVIQKCIECVPTEKIGFIISAFRGQVANLSTHPYGCRVIQRVLEHCSNDPESQCIVDEILEAAYALAQDQYGNYVTQHVLERGKPNERRQIVSKLIGKIVQMSQHKYASNVVEKCLEYGTPADTELLIEEILSQSEDNDNLLIMMKDQFANYVVQKILEISNDRQREMLLNRIRIHLHALKKYTYGKHIVARFEQLSGEDSGNAET